MIVKCRLYVIIFTLEYSFFTFNMSKSNIKFIGRLIWEYHWHRQNCITLFDITNSHTWLKSINMTNQMRHSAHFKLTSILYAKKNGFYFVFDLFFPVFKLKVSCFYERQKWLFTNTEIVLKGFLIEKGKNGLFGPAFSLAICEKEN